MTQENKQLLLVDLCGRLPYGVIVDYKENEFEIPHWKITTIYPNTFDGWIGYDKRVGAGSESGSRPFNIGEVKPYLRPMSSMTEEEKNEFALTVSPQGSAIYYNEYIGIPLSHLAQEIPYKYLANVLDWLNAHHFDYRGLIPKGLALSTEVFNPYQDLNYGRD